MYQNPRRRYILILTFLLSIPCSFVRADSPSSPDNPDPDGSFIQYSTEHGRVIVAKPEHQRLTDDPTFEDLLHVMVACLLALLLTTVMGLFIRHYGLSLRSFTRPGRTKPPSPAARDAEKHLGPHLNSQGRVGLGMKVLDGLDDSELPERPRAAYLKWR